LEFGKVSRILGRDPFRRSRERTKAVENPMMERELHIKCDLGVGDENFMKGMVSENAKTMIRGGLNRFSYPLSLRITCMSSVP
jgi:hypothetical protein